MSTTKTYMILSFFFFNILNGQSPPPPPKPNLPHLPGSVAPTDILCENAGPCSCPAGIETPCNINCEGIDACKDGVIDCNNDGYPCTVNCIGEVSCSGSTIINGPIGSELTVNCLSDKTCEGSMIINGNKGTDVTINCDGMEACIGSGTFNFGNGKNSVNCNGLPSCDGAIFNLPPNADTIPGASFNCLGTNCPPTTPKSFSNKVTEKVITCDGPGTCSCPVGLKDVCSINCIGGSDACKDGLIECNNDGYDCFVNCMEMESCGGATSIMGPSGGALTVQCIGEKSCEGAVSIDAEYGTDLTVICKGAESCKGNVQFNFGNAASSVWCIGEPDSCSGIIFNLPPNADITPGISFNCFGAFCPVEPVPFSNTPSSPSISPPSPPVSLPSPAIIIPPQQQQPQLPSPPLTRPVPVPIPPPASPIIIPQPPSTGTGGVESWCCHTQIPYFAPWQGRCWGITDAIQCNQHSDNRCRWDPTHCAQSKPLCTMANIPCTRDIQCCSGVCRTSAAAQGICR